MANKTLPWKEAETPTEADAHNVTSSRHRQSGQQRLTGQWEFLSVHLNTLTLVPNTLINNVSFHVVIFTFIFLQIIIFCYIIS